MGKSAVFRKGALFAVLAATVYASVRSDETALEPVKPPAPVSAQQPLVSVAPAMRPSDEFVEDSDGSDPFAPRNWNAAPVPEPVKAVLAPPPVAPVIVPEGLPPLPFQYMGRMNDDGNEVVYLGRGDEAMVARMGEVVGSIYKVVGITSTQIEFEHLPTKQRQTLPIQSN